MNRLVSGIALIVLALGLGGATPAQAGSKLFVGGLSWGTDSETVARLVAPYGPVTSIAVVGMDVDGIQSAEATVEFERRRDAALAAYELDGTYVGGQQISADVKPRIVVGSKVKEVVRDAGLSSDADLVQAVSDRVHEILAEAIARCTANGRSTVRPHDL